MTLKNTIVEVAYGGNNTIKENCNNRNKQKDKYTCSGIYKLKCRECEHMYIGQMGRNFRTRFNDHIRVIRHNHYKSRYA